MEVLWLKSQGLPNAQIARLSGISQDIPITLVLDNARYQKCQLVTELASTLAIELLHLPSYSPNLNLIERLWKFVKKQCLYSKYYSDFSLSHILDCCKTPHELPSALFQIDMR